MTLDLAWANAWIEKAADYLAVERMNLIELDRAIGDGDHGENMDRGFSAVRKALQEKPAANPAEVLRTTATTLMSTVGGAAGPLYGTAFLRASKAVADLAAVNTAAIVLMLEGALGGIQLRGKAEEGEKTMVDAWAPAVRAAAAAAADGGDEKAILQAAAAAAQLGAEATEPLIATKGRASYLGERSQGHRDPGAQSTAWILRAAAEVAQ